MSDQYLPPRPEALEKIRHVVVLMLENRSFDNLLGWLYDGRPPPRGQEFEGLHPGMWNPLENVDPDGVPFTERIPVRKNGAAGRKSAWSPETPGTPDFTLPNPDPGEGFRDTNQQLYGHFEVPDLDPPAPLNQGFVRNYAAAMLYGTYRYGDRPTDPREIMTCYTPEQLPVLSALAEQFAVCDHWYASVPSQTLPNRDFVHAATSCGQVNNVPSPECDARTIFERIQEKIEGGRSDLSWRVYSGTEKGKHFSLTRTIMTGLHDPRFADRFLPIERFYEDAASGALPSYAFLEPQFSGPGQNDQHPHSDVRAGEALIARVYEAVRESGQWEDTLLVITYDEHGGTFDHVPPPGNALHPDGKNGAPGQLGFRFNRFGVRVPAVLVSPWIEAGTIVRPAGETPFDHTSIIATLLRCFDLGEPLTERDRAAPDLGCVLTRDEPRADRPTVSPLEPEGAGDSGVHALHEIAGHVLARLTDEVRRKDQDLLDFIHDCYGAFFGAPEESE